MTLRMKQLGSGRLGVTVEMASGAAAVCMASIAEAEQAAVALLDAVTLARRAESERRARPTCSDCYRDCAECACVNGREVIR